jgi:hypothetical protein
MSWRTVAALSLAVAALAAATGMAVASSGSATRPPAWSQIRTFGGLVYSIGSAGRRDAWLTGIETANNNRILVQRWNGTRWRVVSTPRAMFTDGAVIAGASSAANAWVFTLTRPAVAASYAVGWHWTGHAWRSYRLPAGTRINAAAVFSRTDAWAFGMFGAGKPYVIRFDGRKWLRVHAPVSPTSASALSGHDFWIVGPATGSDKAFRFSYEAANWTGTSWRVLKLPHVRISKGMYAAWAQVLAVGPADIWIDFDLYSKSTQGPDSQTLLHYDAGHWTQVGVPRGSMSGHLSGPFVPSNLAADGRGGIWLALAFHHLFGSTVYDYRNGDWSKGAVLARPGRWTIITSIARVPGAGSAWAGGYAGLTTGSSPSHGVLYEYRR